MISPIRAFQSVTHQQAAEPIIAPRRPSATLRGAGEFGVVLRRATLSSVIINNMNERAAAIIIDNGFLLLMHRTKPNKEYYVLPGGSVESDETPEAACIREVEEETGLVITLAKKVLALNNEGRLEHYFLVSTYEGQLHIGKPESDRQSSDNQYALEWVRLEHLEQINLQPPSLRKICINTL